MESTQEVLDAIKVQIAIIETESTKTTKVAKKVAKTAANTIKNLSVVLKKSI